MNNDFKFDEFILSELWGKKIHIKDLRTICINRNILNNEMELDLLLKEMEKKGLVGHEQDLYYARISVGEYRQKGIVTVSQALRNGGSPDKMFYTPPGIGGNRPF